ncbi:DUF2849 domain-containing protein [Acuticoccus sp. M5D2P5]|uniref:DUF2849 domain-containing protein n=1 Tax=Acuticoccus kalidii TaxID=2910977 RepID=UPI001F4516C7|nr:DUF2849 domain-containing protein [Acuticoccus kalidii]MCF3932918.1 DUF2849 domain-containing protein [Acuticoccus kalidii]
MAKVRGPKGPSILTANEILSGEVVYWSGDAWSRSVDDAVRAGDDGARETLTATGKAEEDANRVVGAYLVVLDAVTSVPVELRERRRLAGPSFPLPHSAPHAA